MASEQQRFAHGLRYSAYDAVTSLILGLASSILTARVFGAATIGAFAIAALLTGSLRMISNVREQGGLVRELTRHEPGTPQSRALVWATLVFSTLITIVVLIPFSVLSLVLLHRVFDRPELVTPFLVLVAGYLALDNVAFNLEAPLVAYRDGRAVWLSRLSMSLAMIVATVACALAGIDSVDGIVGCTLAASAVGLIARVWGVRRRIGLRTRLADLRWALTRMRTVIWFGVRQSPLNYSETAIEYTDTAVLGATVSLTEVGAYNRAYGLYTRAMQVPVSVSRLYFPTLSALYHRGDVDGVARLYRLSFRYLVLLLAPACAFVAAAAPQVLAIFGPDFQIAATALSILVFGVVLEAWGTTAGGVLSAADRPGVVSIVWIGVAVINVGLCFTLIPAFGLTGAAIANVGGTLLGVACLWRITGRQLGRSVPWMVQLPFLVRLTAACAVMAAVVLALRPVTAALAWQTLAAPVTLVAGLLVFRPLAREDLHVVERGLRATGLGSPRVLRAALGLHERFSHGPRVAAASTPAAP